MWKGPVGNELTDEASAAQMAFPVLGSWVNWSLSSGGRGWCEKLNRAGCVKGGGSLFLPGGECPVPPLES